MLNKTLIRPVHRGLTLNNILPRLADMKCLILINEHLGCLTLKLDKKSSYLATISCPFGRNQCIRLSFGAGPVGDMFQKKIDELFSGMSNVFGIADDILIIGFDE